MNDDAKPADDQMPPLDHNWRTGEPAATTARIEAWTAKQLENGAPGCMTTSPTIAAELREIAKRMRPNRYDNYESAELLRIADALEVQQAAPDIGAVLTYRSKGFGGVCGNTIGADGSGNFAVVFRGQPVAAEQAAHEELKRLRAAGLRIAEAAIVTSEPLYGGGSGIFTMNVAPVDQSEPPLSMSMFASKADYDKAMGDTVPCNAPTDLTDWQRELMRLVEAYTMACASYWEGIGHNPAAELSAIESHAAQMVQRVAEDKWAAFQAGVVEGVNQNTTMQAMCEQYADDCQTIECLQSQFATAQSRCEALEHSNAGLHATREQWRARCEATEKDAVRWQWLRTQGGWPESEAAMLGALPEEFDSRADAAIAAAKEQR